MRRAVARQTTDADADGDADEGEAKRAEEEEVEGEWVLPWSVPPKHVSAVERIELAGAWNDLANIWYARGEWELAVECFRRSLFWNPEQTAALLNLSSMLARLGFERDATIVLAYYDDVHGGTMGGWDLDRERALRQSIRQGLALAASVPGAVGRTLGELRLADALHLLRGAPASARRMLRASLA
jgi:tetratricopeptide (TPR) repeat protein